MSDKIAIVGVLDKDGSTNVYMAKAFMKLGFEIVPINYRTLMQWVGPRATEQIIIETVHDTKPILTIFCKLSGLNSDVIGYCNKATKTLFWFPDPVVTLKQLPECLSHAKMADFSSCTGKGVADFLKSQTGVRVHHIMEGVDTDYYCPQEMPIIYDVIFIGTRNKERDEHITALQSAGLSVAAFGSGYGNTEVEGVKFCRACGSSKMLLAINNEHTTNEYFSDRVFRYGACGGFVLHSYSPNMEKYFTPGVDLVYFTGVKPLVAAALTYVNNEVGRQQIAASLYNKVLTNHTWNNTVAKILDIFGGGGCKR